MYNSFLLDTGEKGAVAPEKNTQTVTTQTDGETSTVQLQTAQNDYNINTCKSK